jgi:hypothetical protein
MFKSQSINSTACLIYIPYELSRKIYIDAGANRGDTLQSFYGNMPKDTNNHHVKQWNSYFLNTNQTISIEDWEIYAFEASPSHQEDLKKLQNIYKFDLIFALLDVYDNEVKTLYNDDDLKHGHWGASIYDKGIKNYFQRHDCMLPFFSKHIPYFKLGLFYMLSLRHKHLNYFSQSHIK